MLLYQDHVHSAAEGDDCHPAAAAPLPVHGGRDPHAGSARPGGPAATLARLLPPHGVPTQLVGAPAT